MFVIYNLMIFKNFLSSKFNKKIIIAEYKKSDQYFENLILINVQFRKLLIQIRYI